MGKFKLYILTACGAICMSMPICAQGLHPKGWDLSLVSIKSKSEADTVQTSNFAFGLTANKDKLRGMHLELLWSVIHGQASGLQISGLLNLARQNANGCQIAGITNLVGGNINGLQASGLANVTRGKMNGLQISAFSNLAGDMKGMQVSGIANVVSNNTSGIQFSLISNINGRSVRGLQFSGISNVTGALNGFQFASITNISSEKMRGVQVSGVINIAVEATRSLQFSALTNVCQGYFGGVQIGSFNAAKTLNGTQIGLINICQDCKSGLQIGVFNYSRDATRNHKLGLVNINPDTRIQMLVYGGNASKANIAMRFTNKRTYKVFGLGTHYLGMDEKFSGCLFYRTGLYRTIARNMTISGDLGYYHIENFENENADTPERMYSLQARINLEHRISKDLSVFVSSGYSYTRYYDQNKYYQRKAIIEAGIAIF